MEKYTDNNTYKDIPAKQGVTLLAIEDNEINREILQEILAAPLRGETEGPTLLLAKDGKEGMEMLRKHFKDIDVVLLDIQMPVMNGYEVLEAKGKESLVRDIPVIVTTSSNGGDEEARCLELGAQDFIRKPYDPVVVRLRIESIINLAKSTEANRQKALFIQNISHEIRTPMNAIMGFAQVMGSMVGSMDDDDMRMFCNSINNNSLNMMSMIDNMVALSNFDTGTISLKIVDLSPNQICRDAMNDAAFCAPEDIKVSFTTDVDDDFMVKADAKYLKQAVYNYIINAYKYAKEGEVTIHCCLTPEKRLQISVTDTGIDIPVSKADFIFHRFAKLDSFVPGMGLGLTIARKVAESLNGAAYLDTTYTEGSRFVLEIG